MNNYRPRSARAFLATACPTPGEPERGTFRPGQEVRGRVRVGVRVRVRVGSVWTRRNRVLCLTVCGCVRQIRSPHPSHRGSSGGVFLVRHTCDIPFSISEERSFFVLGQPKLLLYYHYFYYSSAAGTALIHRESPLWSNCSGEGHCFYAFFSERASPARHQRCILPHRCRDAPDCLRSLIPHCCDG